jgi:6-pyruvoyltetrahydropterin/6-carboxytetrahydropterin synthase
MAYVIFKEFEISCSHRLFNEKLTLEENRKLFGKCANEPNHGHNYIIRVYLTNNILTNGMVRNFTDVKKVFIEKIDNVYDHQYLNECTPFKEKKLLTTAENMCKVFYDILKKDIREITAIMIWETSKSCAIYDENDIYNINENQKTLFETERL